MVGSGSHVFSVWGYCITWADPESHLVDLNPTLLAATIGDTIDRIQSAIEYLCQPDPNSHCKEYDGARLVKQTGFSYLVVTHEAYRDMQNNEELRVYMREAKRRQRQSKTVKDSLGQSQDPASASAYACACGSDSLKEGTGGETLKDRVGEYAPHVQEVLDARPEYASMVPEDIADIIIKAKQAGMPWQERLKEFCADSANAIQPDPYPLKFLRNKLMYSKKGEPPKVRSHLP